MTAALIALAVIATLTTIAAIGGWTVAVLQARRIQEMRRRLAAANPPILSAVERAKWSELHAYMTSEDGWSNNRDDVPNN